MQTARRSARTALLCGARREVSASRRSRTDPSRTGERRSRTAELPTRTTKRRTRRPCSGTCGSSRTGAGARRRGRRRRVGRRGARTRAGVAGGARRGGRVGDQRAADDQAGGQRARGEQIPKMSLHGDSFRAVLRRPLRAGAHTMRPRPEARSSAASVRARSFPTKVTILRNAFGGDPGPAAPRHSSLDARLRWAAQNGDPCGSALGGPPAVGAHGDVDDVEAPEGLVRVEKAPHGIEMLPPRLVIHGDHRTVRGSQGDQVGLVPWAGSI